MTEFEIDAIFNTICRPGAGGEDPHEERKRREYPGESLEALDNHQGI